MKDTLQKFMIGNASVRGELIEISDAWRQIRERRAYPKAVESLLGEMVAAATLLSANLKFNGTIVMQIHGNGPVQLMVVECDSSLHVRATAKLIDDAELADDTGFRELVNVDDHGRFAITLDPQDKLPGQQPYQGIVPLDGDCLAEVIEQYMLRSEQLDTKLWLAADNLVCRGMLLQKLPLEGGMQSAQHDASVTSDDMLEAWNRVVLLATTLKREELLNTDIATLLHRLFWEETVRVFDPRYPTFQCTCSRDKVANMLKMLGQHEVESALAELGSLSIDCDFCGQHYEFDAIDCTQLFAAEIAADAVQPPTDVRH